MIREPGMRVASKVSSYCSGDHHVPNLELTRTPPTVVLPTSQWWDGTTWKDIYTDEFLRVGRRLVDTCSNSKQNKSKILLTPTSQHNHIPIPWILNQNLSNSKYGKLEKSILIHATSHHALSKILFTPTPFQKDFESNFSNTLEDWYKSWSETFKETFSNPLTLKSKQTFWKHKWASI